jgi:hypothetical protein
MRPSPKGRKSQPRSNDLFRQGAYLNVCLPIRAISIHAISIQGPSKVQHMKMKDDKDSLIGLAPRRQSRFGGDEIFLVDYILYTRPADSRKSNVERRTSNV